MSTVAAREWLDKLPPQYNQIFQALMSGDSKSLFAAMGALFENGVQAGPTIADGTQVSAPAANIISAEKLKEASIQQDTGAAISG